jgi:hypothetical protein
MLKVGVWCAISAAKITGPIFVSWTLNSHRHVTLAPLYKYPKTTHAFFPQENADSPASEV